MRFDSRMHSAGRSVAGTTADEARTGAGPWAAAAAVVAVVDGSELNRMWRKSKECSREENPEKRNAKGKRKKRKKKKKGENES